MIAINYPKDYFKYLFNMIYFQSLNDSELKVKYDNFKNNNFLIGILLINFTIEKILLSKIEDLLNISEQLNRILKQNQKAKEELQNIFNYDNKKLGKTYHNDIKSFFEQNLPMKTCYYCNLDFVNAFNDIYDFHDAVDFVKKASIDDLCKIEGITRPLAKKIDRQKVNLSSIDDLRDIDAMQKQNLKNIVLKEKHSHFTLDHVLPKKDHPLLALSLYNFVPSCYACNSKFKGQNEFINCNTVHFLSPTLGRNFTFTKDVKFRLLFRNGKNTSYVNSKKDFILDFKCFKNVSEYEIYINAFNLRGRYVFHKDEIITLIEKKKKYSDSKILEMSKQLKIPAQKIKEDLFGKELFHGELEDKSMTKFKRDIAEQIGIL
jgi:hypothetical protein